MTERCRRPRRGFTLVELIVAVVLAGWIVSATLRGYAALRSAGERVAAASSATQARRIVRSVLRSELGAGTPDVDWRMHPPDSVDLRAFRGTALPCGPVVDSTVVVRRRGARVPDPSKDSLLILSADGTWTAADLTTRTSGDCSPSEVDPWPTTAGQVERWGIRPLPAAPILLRVFEHGSYHLTGGALRYRRGAGGRQPLTEAVLGSAVFVDSGGVLRVDFGEEHGPGAHTILVRRR